MFFVFCEEIIWYWYVIRIEDILCYYGGGDVLLVLLIKRLFGIYCLSVKVLIFSFIEELIFKM